MSTYKNTLYYGETSTALNNNIKRLETWIRKFDRAVKYSSDYDEARDIADSYFSSPFDLSLITDRILVNRELR